MYKKYFKFQLSPFTITPDPRFLFLSKRHREALAHLHFSIQGSSGFVLLTGEVGMGKTTLSRCLTEQLPDHVDLALIFNPKLNATELVASICDELEIPVPSEKANLKLLYDSLNQHLVNAHANGRTTVLILDEAQNLSVELLEQIRLLSNLETATKKLLQIILIGQPELRDMLSRPELRQFSQRITARYHISPLDVKETADYILYRLNVAGRSDPLFTPRAIREVFRRSGGMPRLINKICDRSLLGAYALGSAWVDDKIVRAAILEVMEPEKRPFRKKMRFLAAGLAAGLLFWLLVSKPSIFWTDGWSRLTKVVWESDDTAVIATHLGKGLTIPVPSRQDPPNNPATDGGNRPTIGSESAKTDGSRVKKTVANENVATAAKKLVPKQKNPPASSVSARAPASGVGNKQPGQAATEPSGPLDVPQAPSKPLAGQIKKQPKERVAARETALPRAAIKSEQKREKPVIVALPHTLPEKKRVSPSLTGTKEPNETGVGPDGAVTGPQAKKTPVSVDTDLDSPLQVVAPPQAQVKGTTTLLETVLTDSRFPTRLSRALFGLYDMWQVDATHLAGQPTCLKTLQLGLACLHVTGNWNRLRTMNIPVIIQLVSPQRTHHSAVVTGLDNKNVRLRFGSREITASVLDAKQYWFGNFIVMFRPTPDNNINIWPQTTGKDVLWLRDQLQQIQGQGFQSPNEGFFDLELGDRVRQFQKANNLGVDGIVGPMTLIAIDQINRNKDRFTPMLTPLE